MYKHLTFDDLLAFSFCNLLSLRWKSAATLIVLQEVACVIKCNNDLRKNKKGVCFSLHGELWYYSSSFKHWWHSRFGVCWPLMFTIHGSAFVDYFHCWIVALVIRLFPRWIGAKEDRRLLTKCFMIDMCQRNVVIHCIHISVRISTHRFTWVNIWTHQYTWARIGAH